MNRRRYFLWVRDFAMALLFLALAWADAGSVCSQTVSTNWLSMNELLKKWEPVSFNEVGRAATNGDLSARHYLGYCYMEGFRVAKDPGAAATWYESAMRGGYLPSANNLGVLYQNGLLGSNKMSKALYYFRYAAERNLPVSQYNLGLLYRDGRGVAQNTAEAAHWFKLAADAGYAAAKEIAWPTNDAEATDPHAQYLLGRHYEYPEGDRKLVRPDLPKALHWYRLSAEQGWTDAQYKLGHLYLEGKVTELDEERGLELIRAAADKGLEDAVRDLAHLYAQGIGEPRNEQDRPMELLIRSGEWQELVIRYERGLGTPQDLIAAASCYCKLSPDPDVLKDKIEFKARHRAWGREGFVESGEVPDDDLLRVLSLYLKSARGDGEAARQLGDFYLTGQNAPRSDGKAWAWFSIAAENGSAGARQKAASLAAQMTGKELETAREYQHSLKEDLKNVAFLITPR